MKSLKLTLPLPPSANHCYIQVRFGKRLARVLSGKAKKWKETAAQIAKIEIIDQKWKLSEKEKIVMEMNIFWPDNRKHDPDNTLKLTQDSLNGLVYVDDRFVLPRVLDFSVDRLKPRLELRIFEKAQEDVCLQNMQQ